MTDDHLKRVQEHGDRMMRLLDRVRKYHSALSDIATVPCGDDSTSAVADIARKALRQDLDPFTEHSLLLPRDLEQMVEELQGTIHRSLDLALQAVDTPEEVSRHLRDGIEQAARNIAAAIEEYGR